MDLIFIFFNLLPRHAADKGYAVCRLIEQAGALRTLYVGDDVTDEDVFSLRRDDVFSVRVGCEAGPDITAAMYCIPTVASIEFFLDQLVDILSADKFQSAHFNQANQR